MPWPPEGESARTTSRFAGARPITHERTLMVSLGEAECHYSTDDTQGLPGVMNVIQSARNRSAGHPQRKSERKSLREAPSRQEWQRIVRVKEQRPASNQIDADRNVCATIPKRL
jgi:hypothetical protein